MAAADRAERARELYHAFVVGERTVPETLLSDDFSFSSPVDPQLDRAGYFERCWPQAGAVQRFDIVRAVESGDEVLITYEATRPDGTRFCNTEVMTFAGDQISRSEVYFGWDLP
jgi:hypothetical protein